MRPRKPARDIAIADGASRYFTGEPCKRGHLGDRDVRSRHCIACEQERKRPARPEVTKRAAKRWRDKNPEFIADYQRKWRANNPEKSRASSKRWNAKNRPWTRERNRAYARERSRKAGAALRALKELGIEL